MKTKWISALSALAIAAVVALADNPTPPATQPSADDQMNKLLGNGTAPAKLLPAPAARDATDKTSGPGAVAPGAPVLPLVREGTHLIEHTGRLNHTPDGTQAIFTFDSDGKTMKDAPMIILPNLKLMSMEGAALAASKDVRFRISGTVTEYKGRNYILLDKIVVVADIDQGL
jgi:hypothetical protein